MMVFMLTILFTLSLFVFLWLLLNKTENFSQDLSSVWGYPKLELFLWQSGFEKQQIPKYVYRSLLLGGISMVSVLFVPQIGIYLGGLLAILLVCWLVQRRMLRQESVQEELVSLAGNLSLAVSAGQDLWAALQATSLSSQGILARECQMTMAAFRLGQDRRHLFDEIMARYPVTKEFFLSLQRAQEQGISFSSILQEQSRRWRQHRLLRAEARLGRLPVLLLGPLAFCIFPNIFVALLGPFLVSFW